MKKAILFWMLGVSLSVTEALAVPACPEPFEATQSDGTRVRLHKRGDEFLKWYEDADGFTVIKDEKSKDWFYAELSANASMLVPSKVLVGSPTNARPSSRRILPQRAIESSRAKRSAQRQQYSISERGIGTSGSVRQLVILVEFSDQKFVHTRQQFDDLFNKIGYSEEGNKGSVRDYYKEVSYNQIDVQSTVVGPISLSNTYAYYGENDEDGDDMRLDELCVDAVTALDNSGFDFSQFDSDGDGWLDELDIIHAGWGEEFGNNSEDNIWSARWYKSISSAYYIKVDGVKIHGFHTEPELRESDDIAPSSCKITQVGVICHEFGHSLGLPDLYDTDNEIGETSEGVGDFCLMGGGSWGYVTGDDQGTCPVPMSAWCKKKLGWVVPTEITTAGHYSLARAEDNAKVYILKGNLPGEEYFLVENKTATGFGRGLPGTNKGMLIWHVDEAKSNNRDESHYMVDLEEASGTQHLENDSNRGNDSDYFRSTPLTMSSFTATTSPNNKSYSGTALGMSITSISAPGATMTFDVSVGDAPVTRPANDNFANAKAISGMSGTASGSNVNATSQSGEPLLTFKSTATTTVWWKWTAPSSGTVQIDTIGSSFDTVLGVYVGSSLTTLARAAASGAEDDDGGGNRTSKCTFACAGGTTYYICVAGWNGKTGTIKLNWSLLQTYGIVYNKGAYGTGSQQTATKIEGVALTLKGAIFTRTGYTQTGWATSSAGVFKAYDLGASYTADAAITLYPYWTANTYSVNYSLGPGGMHGTWHPTSATFDSAFAFEVSAPTRQGYVFSGWSVTDGLDPTTAKWGTSSIGLTAISSSSVKCANGPTGSVYFKNLTPLANGCVTLTANWLTGDDSLATALDNNALVFTTGGDAQWFCQGNRTHDGMDAAQSGAITDNQSSWMQTTVTGPGRISFWWYASTESASWDYLEFSVDGFSKAKIGGTTGGWSQCAYLIDAGSHTLVWTYRKDSSGKGGLDTAFVDQVEWTTEGVGTITEIEEWDGRTAYLVSLLSGGKSFAVPASWFADAGINISDGVTPALMNVIGRNGLPRYQSFLFGLEPESATPADKQLCATISFDGEGCPVISCLPKSNNSHVLYTTLGKPSLGAAEWVEVTPGNKASMKFFKVKVELAK